MMHMYNGFDGTAAHDWIKVNALITVVTASPARNIKAISGKKYKKIMNEKW